MRAVGIITEYNPFHWGHLYQIEQIRACLGPETAVICVMSGNFVQRGDFAIVRKHVRAEAAVLSGADLVIELPVSWALSSAERFARGGVQLLRDTGVVSHLAFGSESGDTDGLMELARGLLRPEFPDLLRQELRRGDSFPHARQRAVETLLGHKAYLIREPNDILGVEYCKAILQFAPGIAPLAIARRGARHDGETADGIASASQIRRLLIRTEAAEHYMSPSMAQLYEAERMAGRAPVDLAFCQRAILARLRMMEEEAWRPYDEGKEGLYHRFYEAAQRCTSVEQLLKAVKTRRYPLSRLRRMLLRAYLGLQTPEQAPPYLRVLAAGPRGTRLLAQMRDSSRVPVLTKPADVRSLGPQARFTFEEEARSTDLYVLAYPELKESEGGGEWRTGPRIVTP